jgi:hypothetical protein
MNSHQFLIVETLEFENNGKALKKTNFPNTRRNLKINDWICDSFIVVMDTCDYK